MAIENLQTIKGTLYSKDVRKVPNKKTPTEPDYEFLSIKVEYKLNFGGKDRTHIPEMQLDRGVGFEEFTVGDAIMVDFYMTGKQIGTWYKTEAKVVHIGFTDRASSYDNHKGKIKVDSMSDINTIGDPPKPNNEIKDKVFVTPSPNDDDELGDLPF